MCDKCTKLDQKIAHYRDIAVRMTDERTLGWDRSLDKRNDGRKGDAPLRTEREVRPPQLGASFICRYRFPQNVPKPLFVIHARSLEQARALVAAKVAGETIVVGPVSLDGASR